MNDKKLDNISSSSLKIKSISSINIKLNFLISIGFVNSFRDLYISPVLIILLKLEILVILV